MSKHVRPQGKINVEPERDATPVTEGKRVVMGRQFTKRTAEVFPNGMRLEQIDVRDVFTDKTIEEHKQAAIDQLEAVGIPAQRMLAAGVWDDDFVLAPGGVYGGTMLDYVVNYRGHEIDSPIGLAARICELCIRLQDLLKLGAPTSMLMANAYRLGRLVTLEDAYEVKHRVAANAGANLRTSGDRTREAVKKAWEDDASEGKPEWGRVARVALKVHRSESAVRSALKTLKIRE